MLAKETGRNVNFMPEFLTERTAYEDFCSQPMVFTAEEETLAKIFVGKKIYNNDIIGSRNYKIRS